MGLETIVLGAAAGLNAFSAISEGNAKDEAAQQNARIAEENARVTRQQAEVEERNFRTQAQKEMGGIRASVGASGVDFGGSASDVLRESAKTAEMDALNIKHRGELKAIGFQQEAENFKREGKQARTSGILKGAGAILQGGASMAGKL